MEVLIQHNVHAGLGDYTHSIYRYFYLVEELKKLGYKHITLYINMERTSMFNKDYFFVLYDRKVFEELFDDIIISDNKIGTENYDNLKLFYVNGHKEIGINQFDIFIDYNDEKFELFKINLHNFFVSNTLKKYRYLFSEYIMNKYRETNVHKNEEYVAIQFRAGDSKDNEDLYKNHEEQFKKIISEENKVFVCSNSYKFKEYIKGFNYDNVFMFDFPFEKEYGNHLGAIPLTENFNHNEYQTRTLHAAIDMLTLSQSKEIYSFNYFGHVDSNFIKLAISKNVKFHIIPLIGGMMWKPENFINDEDINRWG